MNFDKWRSISQYEIERLISYIDEDRISAFIGALNNAQLNNSYIVGLGAGRMGYSLRAFIMRLSHLGFKTSMIGDTSVPRIGKNDLVIVNSSSGMTPSIVLYTLQAADAGAFVVSFTTNESSKIAKLSDIHILYGQQLEKTQQFMKTAYEQATFVLFDIITNLIIETLKIDTSVAEHNHSILE
jgi:6-phospho-3-hexuloisomerase